MIGGGEALSGHPSEIATAVLKKLPKLLSRYVDADTDW
jgi:hypothetical protein